MNRRDFLLGGGALLTAPAIVRVGSIMPVKVVSWDIATAQIAGIWWRETGALHAVFIPFADTRSPRYSPT